MCSLVSDSSLSNGHGLLKRHKDINSNSSPNLINNLPIICGNSRTHKTHQHSLSSNDCITLCCPNKLHGCEWTGTLANAVDHVQHRCSYNSKENTMPVVLTMTGFESKRRNRERWYSRVFCTHEKGYHFRLKVDANGWCGGAVAVVVSIVKGDYDDQLQWPFEGVITVQILNHIRNSAHSIVKVFTFSGGGYECQRVLDEAQPEYGCWCNRFIMHKSLHYNPVRQTQYLTNDSLLFLVNHKSNLY